MDDTKKGIGDVKPVLKEGPRKTIHVYALLFFIVCFAAVLTWIIPAGKFDTMENPNTGVTQYVAGSYHQVEANPQNLWDVFKAVFSGWINSADLVFAVFAMGAWVEVVQATGLIERSFGRLVKTMAGKEKVAVLVITFVMALTGAVGVKPTIPLLPLGILLAISLGYDAFVGLMMMFIGNGIGFAIGPFQVQSVGIAHEIAGLPRFSGSDVRIALFLISYAIVAFFMVRYMRKLERDKSASLADASQLGDIAKMKLSDYESQPLSWRDILNIIISFGGFAFLMYGVAAWKWSTKDYGPLFLAVCVASGIVGRLSVDTISNSIVKGFEKIVLLP